MPPWELIFSSQALSQLSKLPDEACRRILAKLEEISPEPMRYLSRLSGHDEFKLRVGDYRILILALQAERILFIGSIGKRESIYKTLNR